MAGMRIAVHLLLSLLAMGASVPLHAAVQVSSQRTLEVNEDILDVAVTHSGKWIYVLTGKGEVLVYSGSGQLSDRISVGPGVDGIRVGPREETLVLTSRGEKRIRVIVLDFVKRINSAGSPFKGREDAPVEITVFSEFQCSYCASLAPVLDRVLRKYDGRVKIVFKHFPLRSHPFAMTAAAAAVAAHNQGRFWEFHDGLFRNMKQLSYEKLLEIAVQVGLDKDRFTRDMQSRETQARIRQDMADANQAGVAGTPSVFINGRALTDRTMKGFDSVLVREMKSLTEAGEPARNEPD
ncbi:MAG: thioredoxin domain-containing protein [Thermodesulfobacteriota bacterium]